MRYLFLILSSCVVFVAHTQITGKVEDYRLGSAELVVFPFGMDHKVVLGNINDKGSFNIDFINLDDIKVENKGLWYADITEALLISCDDQSLVFSDSISQAFTVDNIFIWQDNVLAGMLYTVTDPKLKDYQDQLYFAEVPIGKFLNFIYVDRPTSLTGKCIIEHENAVSEASVNESIFYNVVLSQGWNILQTSIEKVQQLDEDFTIPIEQRIESIPAIQANFQWIVKTLE